MNENERHLRDNYFDASRQSPQSQMSSNYLNYQPNSEEPATQNENFSFLSDGRGNFLKIYYEGRGQNIPKKYELFSNESNPTFTGTNLDKGTNQNFYSHYQSQGINQVPSQEMHFQQAQQQPQQQPQPQNQPTMTNAPQSQNKTNMLINQLIHQWTPNMSGTYQPFGEPTGFSIMTSAPNLSAQTPSTVDANQPVGCFTDTAENVVLNDFTNKENIHNSAINKPADDGTTKPNIQTRKRIIAEVKPMRMSYSDVLNKNIINDGQPPVSNDPTINTNVQNGNGSVPVHPSVKNFKGDKIKFASNFEKKTIEINDKTKWKLHSN